MPQRQGQTAYEKGQMFSKQMDLYNKNQAKSKQSTKQTKKSNNPPKAESVSTDTWSLKWH